MSITCSICFENVDFSNEEISVLNCGHLYHKTCVQPWLSTNPSCPECRAKVGKKGIVQKIYPQVKSEISYDGVSDETKSLFKVYEEQAKNMQKMFLERFVALEKELTKEKSSHAETLKELEQQRSDNCSLRSELKQLKTQNDDKFSRKRYVEVFHKNSLFCIFVRYFNNLFLNLYYK